MEKQIKHDKYHGESKTRTHTGLKGKLGKDQEKAQSESDSHSNNRGVKKVNQLSGTDTMKTYCKPNEQLFFSISGHSVT